MTNISLRKFFMVGLFFLAGSLISGHLAERQVVTVHVTYQAWNEYRPWQKKSPKTRICLGSVISGNRILLPAGCLENATLIQLEKYDRPPRTPARILHCDYQVGLALLAVDESNFFNDLNPVQMAEFAGGAQFYCATWKSGQFSLSSCRWSQVKSLQSSVPYFKYAGIYFITDLKNGGRGEPVFNGEQMVGMAYSQDDDRISVLPIDLIRAYINAAKQPKYPGFASLGIAYQYNRGKAQAAWFGQQGIPAGIRIRECFPGGSADGILHPDDILLKLGGHVINSQGGYEHPHYGLMDVELIATEGCYAGDVITAQVLRNKTEIELRIPLKNIPPSSALIPAARPDRPPPYLVAGGLVFRELDVPYLKAWERGKNWKNDIPPALRILYEMHGEKPTPEQKRLIVLTDVFPDEYNLGYHELSQKIVRSVNGRNIDSIREMEEAFQYPENGYHIIEFMPSYGMSRVILDAEVFERATAAIMKKYQIPERIRLNP